MKPVYFSPQQGMSLISLMVGLMISMLITLTCMVVYKNLIQVSTDNKTYSGFDGRISLAEMVLEKSVQSAGFGIADASEEDIKVRHNGTQLQLLWRYSDIAGTAYTCEGFEEITTQDSEGNDFREIRMIRSGGCNETADLTALSWNVDSLLARWKMTDDEITKYIDDNSSLFSFSVTEGECTSFGRSLAEENSEHYILTVKSPDAAYLFNPSVPVSDLNICLYNFHPEAI
ncbi:MAG: hypothetical protein CMI02_11925 [Oceanospirillaceae bacterium]|nr:hypothetical protein [Oceanospirillaceae bacterium]MBT12727.1 hypothetical protein [Oceanospirillaceae bacterium]|tara:strand:- start:1733 stop:2422 length:690 start_codon:yes stop_codon:yes gene_type:complete